MDTPQVGDIWKDLDQRVEYQRFVKVSAFDTGNGVRIYAVEKDEDGKWVCARNGKTNRPAPERWSQLKRFNGKSGGYGLHERLVPKTGKKP
jgi:hypothetical protein